MKRYQIRFKYKPYTNYTLSNPLTLPVPHSSKMSLLVNWPAMYPESCSCISVSMTDLATNQHSLGARLCFCWWFFRETMCGSTQNTIFPKSSSFWTLSSNTFSEFKVTYFIDMYILRHSFFYVDLHIIGQVRKKENTIKRILCFCLKWTVEWVTDSSTTVCYQLVPTHHGYIKQHKAVNTMKEWTHLKLHLLAGCF